MKKHFLFLSAVALLSLTLNSSCNKDKDDPTPNSPSGPNLPDPNNPGDPNSNTPQPSTPMFNGVDGTLVSVIMEYSFTNEYLPDPIIIETEVGVAAFPASNGTDLVPAGNVSVNDYALTKAENNSYYVTATVGTTPSTLDFSSTSNWSVSGQGSIASFTYNHNVTFPDFTGNLPTSITKASGLTIDLSSVSNADSVYLVIAAGDQYVQKAVHGSASSISVSASDLQNLPTVSDNTAMVQIAPFRFELENIGGKTYAFVKEKVRVASVNIQ